MELYAARRRLKCHLATAQSPSQGPASHADDLDHEIYQTYIGNTDAFLSRSRRPQLHSIALHQQSVSHTADVRFTQRRNQGATSVANTCSLMNHTGGVLFTGGVVQCLLHRTQSQQQGPAVRLQHPMLKSTESPRSHIYLRHV